MLIRVKPTERLRCAEAEQALHWLADGELSDEREQNELRGHVAVCPSCKRAWDRLTEEKRALAALRTADDDAVDALVARVHDRIDADVRAERVRVVAVVGIGAVIAAGLALAAC